MNDTINLMNEHRSIRSYTDDPIPAEHIRAAVEAGQMASTSSAVQAYCLIRVTDADRRRRLAELAGNQEKVARSPEFFIVCGDTRRHRLLAGRAGQPYRGQLEAFLLAVIDASLFTQNLVLAFESLGYGICYIGGLRNDVEAVIGLMELPEGIYPLFGLCVGKPEGEKPLRRPRLPVEAVLFDDAYPGDDEMLRLTDAYDEAYAAYQRARQAGASADGWSPLMEGRFAEPSRVKLGSAYRAQGADLT